MQNSDSVFYLQEVEVWASDGRDLTRDTYS